MSDNDSTAANTLPEAGTPSASVESASIPEKHSDEDSTLARLKLPDLSGEAIEQISKSGVAANSRKVKLAIIRHPRTPRYVSLALLRKLFTFDLMQVALIPAVAGDVKVAAEEALLNRLESVSAGEKLSLAHRASGRVAGELLLDTDPRIITTALENPRLTEALVIKAVFRIEASRALVQAICAHPKWSVRREIRIALLRSEHTPEPWAAEFVQPLPGILVKEILRTSRLPEDVKLRLASSVVSNARTS